jgi:hypothetical protein
MDKKRSPDMQDAEKAFILRGPLRTSPTLKE